MQNVLIIGAHFDDAELGVGGTAAKLSEEGKQVYKLTLTDNVTHSQHLQVHVSFESSVQSSSAACKVLNIKEITEFQPVSCCYLIYDTKIMRRIEDVIYGYHIDSVFLHYWDDINQDHIAASKLSLTAARHCENIIFFQSNLYIPASPFTPNYFVDISQYIERKRQALARYKGDHDRNHRLFETNLERNHVWGYMNQVPYAEGFVAHKILIK